jgi:hypothetical protein
MLCCLIERKKAQDGFHNSIYDLIGEVEGGTADGGKLDISKLVCQKLQFQPDIFDSLCFIQNERRIFPEDSTQQLPT